MSYNDGGDPIRLSKAPVEAPPILRGMLKLPRSYCPHPRETLTWVQMVGDIRLTYHDCKVAALWDDEVVVYVRPETTVTWERVPGFAPQI